MMSDEYPTEIENHNNEKVSVFSFAGTQKGTFDETHVVGSEVTRGTPSELAVDRARRVRNIIELVGEPKVSTDSIRYILDGLRDVEKGDKLSTKQLRDFREHITEEASRIKSIHFSPKVDHELGKIDLPRFTDADIIADGEDNDPFLYLANWQQVWQQRKQIDCYWDLIRRSSRHFIEILSIDFKREQENLASTKLTETHKTQLVEEIKRIIKHKLSSSITLERLGLSSSVSLDSEATKQKLTELVTTRHFVLIQTFVRLKVNIKMRRRIDFIETWGWKGDDCPLQSYVPEKKAFTLYGKTRTYQMVHEDEYFILRQDLEHANKVTEEYWWNRTEEDFMKRFSRSFSKPTSGGAGFGMPPWMPELPWPKDTPPNIR